MSTAIPVAVLGATGYAGEHSIRILLGHPGFRIVHAGSDRLAGTALAEAVPAFAGETDLILAPDTPEAIRASEAQAVVLCKKSPEVTKVVPALLEAGLRLVDIGAEFRLKDPAAYATWYKAEHDCPELLAEAVYGLSEVAADAIAAARVVGNPGCYATSMLLPLIPLLKADLIDTSRAMVVVGYSGVSGAGKRFIEGNNNLYYAMDGNIHSYKALGHQHQAEVDQELSTIAGKPVHVQFVPHLAPLTRGIHSTISCTLKPGADAAAATAAWRAAYQGRPFVRIHADPKSVEVANVAGTNYCDIGCVNDGDCLVICSAIDNLVKGAAGQAIQNLNLMYGYDEALGLRNRGI
ncbi:MAG: N-acetyl-gamma-glutamyl-phosphate reductase [Planctomycetota bacterium]|jgi:N-acetyl-gamma-glutamyl-phosphate reductase|nr:N-acetyl-gamma-glutamyl-phosphate reductase [Planctomycetota bacterium]